MFGWKTSNWKAGLGIYLLLIAFGRSTYAQSSVLAEGTWIKIGVTKTGIYKLNDSFFRKNGLTTSPIDPRTIRLFGNGGATLPQANNQPRPTALTENAIWVTGEEDGRFDADDAVYFFAESPHPIGYDSTAGRLTHRPNWYTDTTYYFLTIGKQNGKRIAAVPPASSAAATITEFDDYSFYQASLNMANLVRSGRVWFEYIGTDKTISFNLPGLVASSTALVTSDVVGRSTSSSQFQLKWGAQVIGNQKITAVYDGQYDPKGSRNVQTFSLPLPAVTSPVQIGLSYDKTGQGYLQSVALQTRRTLRRYDSPFLFRALEARRYPTVQYVIQQATSTMQVWDVTNRQQIGRMTVSTTDQSEGIVKAAGGPLREYFVFSPDQAAEPEAAVKIGNQNVQVQTTPNLLIVTPAAWRAQAERLAEFRRSTDSLEVAVVNTQAIYNEFGSGQPDPTAIRDFVRMLYTRTPGKLQYLLLFGDATYDYKNYTKLMSPAQLAATVPTYESRESLHPVLSYSSDDYFGFMDPTEGEWTEDFSGDHTLDIGIGRLPAKSVAEAQAVVDKLIRYASLRSQPGDWRTKLAFVADDGDSGFPNIHQTYANNLAQRILTMRPPVQVEKIFVDSFTQESSPSGQKAPLVNQAITKALNEGRLIVNYTGHGGETGWAEEQILTLQDILNWSNPRLPLFITATCQFGRFDEPGQTSGAELTMLNAKGGGIALLTTGRPVYANTNDLLNRAFYDALAQGTAKGAPRLGDLMQHTKNNSLSGSLNRNFSLLGDPSLQLAYPKATAELTGINGKSMQDDTLRALESVRLDGEIRQNGQLQGHFNGQVKITFFDKADTLTTFGTEDSPPMAYTEYLHPLYSGQASVRNGKFTHQFVVPKDLDYRVGFGKVYLYAVSADGSLDAAGSTDSLLVGGSSSGALADNQPPVIRLYGEDSTFVDGGTVSGPNVTIIAQINDENGINIARNGIGHELTLQLNSEEPVVVNDYFTPTQDNYRAGTVRYRWKGLTPGAYTARLKAWDVYNNPAVATLNFIVSGQPSLAIHAVDVTPNPFLEKATFRIQHNRPEDALEIKLTIVDLRGRIVTEHGYECAGCGEFLTDLSWNGTTLSGAPAAPGLYVYQLTVRSKADGSVAHTGGKLLYVR